MRQKMIVLLLAAGMVNCGHLCAAQPVNAELRRDLVMDLMDAMSSGQTLLAGDLRAVLTVGFDPLDGQTTVIVVPTPAGAHLDPSRPGVALRNECPNIPLPKIAGTETICHAAYVSLYDADLKVPRLVAYELTGPHTLGCVPRASGFHKEGDSAAPSAYDGTGYDLGHMSPAQDNAWSDAISHDSFSMVNIVPQLPGLNRQEWERLEEDVRAWALDRGDLLIYVGPVIADKPKKIGDVGIPWDFFKIIVDRKTGEVLAFDMPQQAIAKQDVKPWLSTVGAIEQETGIKFPALSAKDGGKTVWAADLGAWHKAHKAACGKD